MRARKTREREILHNYMEALARNYVKMEPNEMSSSICRIYDSLNGRVHDSRGIFLARLTLVNFFVSIVILVINLSRRKSDKSCV